MDWENEVEELNKRKKLAKKQGGKESVKLHHKKRRLTLRERIDYILDNKSFLEIGEGAGYAGGIMSAAMDGQRVALKIVQKVIEQ